jgi:hypothetical protein
LAYGLVAGKWLVATAEFVERSDRVEEKGLVH